MTTYNKLIRDKIPEIVEDSGKKPMIHILDKDTYYKELVKKLLEETNEFIESDNPEEIADILEVIDALIKARGISKQEIIKIQQTKRSKRGGFDKRIFLEEVIE